VSRRPGHKNCRVEVPMASPRFSVVVACHNQRNFIAQTIESALSQICLDREIIVVDDASTDDTASIAKGYGDRIRLISWDVNQGASAARNAGTEVARGAYIVYLDGDDVLKPWALSVYDQIIQARNPAIILTGLAWFRGEPPALTPADAPDRIEIVTYDNLIDRDRAFQSSASALIVERGTLKAMGGWTKEVWPFDDQYLALELAYSGRTVHIVDPQTVFYRTHAANTVGNVPLLISGGYRLAAAWKCSRRIPRNLRTAALIGSPETYALRRAFRARLWRDGLRLFVKVWPWIVAAALVRLRRVFVQSASETISVQIRSSSTIHLATAAPKASVEWSKEEEFDEDVSNPAV